MAEVKTKIFTVRFRGAMQADMLRYDSCWPHRSEDAAKFFPGPHASEKERGWRLVELMTNSKSAPTHGRWESFNCKVISVRDC